MNENQTIIKTDVGVKDGQDKCPKCGATDIATNVNSGKLRCNYCRYEFESEKVDNLISDISNLKGEFIGSGATSIIEDTNDIITFKCSSCGAEVVINTSESTQARCHWCRNTLSQNSQVPNGAVPDLVLPFGVTKDAAKLEIEKFVGKRKFFAHPKFKSEFTTNNLLGVYFPYMLVDINAHANLIGEGEIQTRKYYKKSGNSQQVYYDADLYHIERDFDITINSLSIESSKDKLNNNKDKTNNVINAIMPFDVENCVKYNSNYLKGYSSEKRDVNIDQLREVVDIQARNIAKFKANESLTQYNRGVSWHNESLNVLGKQWTAAYLPVWLYSYQQVSGNKKILHYVAVNARTKETMGSIPIHIPKLIGVSLLVEILGIFLLYFVDWDYDFIFLFSGIIFFFIIYLKYRNADARHTYEVDTKTNMSNLKKVDSFIKSKRGLTNAYMNGANNKTVSGSKMTSSFNSENISNTVINSVTKNSPLAGFIMDNIDKGGKK